MSISNICNTLYMIQALHCKRRCFSLWNRIILEQLETSTVYKLLLFKMPGWTRKLQNMKGKIVNRIKALFLAQHLCLLSCLISFRFLSNVFFLFFNLFQWVESKRKLKMIWVWWISHAFWKRSHKGQLNSERIYEVIVSPKMQTWNCKDFCPTKQTRIVVCMVVGQKSF